MTDPLTPDEWALLGMIECRCGDVFPTVESMHDHIHLSHPNADHEPARADTTAPFTLEMFDALQEVLAAHIYETSGDQGDGYFCRMCDADVTTNDPHAEGCEYMLLRRWTLDRAALEATDAPDA